MRWPANSATAMRKTSYTSGAVQPLDRRNRRKTSWSDWISRGRDSRLSAWSINVVQVVHVDTRKCLKNKGIYAVVPRRGLEPPRIAPLVPETSASTSSATWAGGRLARRRNLRTHEGLVNRSLVALLHDFPANAGATLTHPIGDMAGQGGVPLYCFIMFKTGQNVATM